MPVFSRAILATLMVGTCLSSLPLNARAADAGAPATAKEPVSDSYYGITVGDDYRWLEESGAQSPRVKAWTAQQNDRTRQALDASPRRSAIRAKVAALIGGSTGAWFDFEPRGKTLFAIHADPKGQQPLLIALDKDVDPDKGRVVLDLNATDPSGATAMDWYQASPDGRLIGASLSKGGSEVGDLTLIDAATGKPTGETIPHVQYPTGGGDMAWQADGKGFWYTRYPGTERPEADRAFYQGVFFHKIGTDPAKDKRILPETLPKIAETKFDNRYNPSLTLIAVANGDGGEVEHFIIDAKGKTHQITTFADVIRQVVIGPDGAAYLVSRKGSPNGRVLKLAPGDYDLKHAKEIIPAATAALPPEGDVIVPTKDRLYVRYVAGGPSEVQVFDPSGKAMGPIALPPVSAVREMTLLGDGDLLLGLNSFVRPAYTARWNPSTAKLSDTKIFLGSPAKFDDAEVMRGTATSKDGTKIPYTLVARKGVKLDGTNPLLLTGYGGYGVVEAPRFLGARGRILLDHGGIYVSANLRGGGDFGDAWHQAGNLTRKQTVFDDMAAVAQALIDTHYTSPAHLAIEGGSNGGLLMGAMLTQHPELMRAVVSHVGIYDMLRVELDPNGAFNITEFGTVKDKAQFDALYAYSPYHHVTDGTAYPSILLMAGENDGRVNPLHSRKFAARLQAATGSKNPVYLLTDSKAGHGMGSPIEVIIDQTADALTFLMDQLDVANPYQE